LVEYDENSGCFIAKEVRLLGATIRMKTEVYKQERKQNVSAIL
jgi:hypothetical protein